MTLLHALGALDAESDYSTTVMERLSELIPDDETLDSTVSFTYAWTGGYERVTVRHAKGGGSEYRGSYHPNVVCETGTRHRSGVCIRCGRTLM